SLTIKRNDNEELINRLRELKANLEGDIIKLEKTLRLDSDDLDSDKGSKNMLKKEITDLDIKIDEIINKLSQLNSELGSLKQDKQKLRDQINNPRNPALLAELTSYEQKKSELKDEINNLKLEMRKAESEALNIYGPEKDNIQKI